MKVSYTVQRLVTVTWLLNTNILSSHGAERRWKPHTEPLDNHQRPLSARRGPRSHDAKTGYTTMSKAKDIKHPHDLTGRARM